MKLSSLWWMKILRKSRLKQRFSPIREGNRTAYIWHPAVRPKPFIVSTTSLPPTVAECSMNFRQLSEEDQWDALLHAHLKLFEWILGKGKFSVRIEFSTPSQKSSADELDLQVISEYIREGSLSIGMASKILLMNMDRVSVFDQIPRVEEYDTWECVVVYVSDDEFPQLEELWRTISI